MRPLISVVVPLYNKASLVGRALRSISGQSLDDFEVIVVDDGSTDDSADAAVEYFDSRFRLVTQSNQGPGVARNRGIAEATGDFVAFLDADDEWLASYLEIGVKLLTMDPELAACACSYFEYPRGASTEELWRRRSLKDGPFVASSEMSAQVFMHVLAFLSPCTTVARTAAVRRYGGFYAATRCTYGEDTHLWLKILLNERVYIDLKPRVRVHREAAQLSNSLLGPRELEPFLQKPDDVASFCPANLKPLLTSVLTLRALKTSAVWGYWGRRKEARDLRHQFKGNVKSNTIIFWRAFLFSTRIGCQGANLWRFIRRIRESEKL